MTPTPTFPTNSYKGSNYWVDPVFTPSPAPGQVTEVSAPRRSRLGDGVLGARPPAAGPVTTYTITPYVGFTTAQKPTTVTGTPPATSALVSGLTARQDLHVHGAGLKPQRLGAGVGASNSVTPTAPVRRRRRATWRAAGEQVRRWSSWSAPSQRTAERRSPDTT